MRISKTVSALLVAAFLAPAAFSAPPMADKVPEGALLYVGSAGRSLTFDGCMLGRMLQEPEVGKIVAGARSALAGAIGPDKDGQAALEHAWAMAGIAWERPAAVALFDLSVRQRPGRGHGAPEPLPVGAVLIDLGPKRPAFADHLKKLLTVAGKHLKITQAAVGKVSYQSFQTPAGPCGVGFVGDVFFASIGAKSPETVVGVLGGKLKALSGSARFAAAMKEVAGEQVQVASYVDVKRLFGAVEKVIGAAPAPATAPADVSQFRRIIKALGLANVSAIARAANVVDGGIYDKARIFSPAPHRGVLMLLAGKPLPADALAGVPADADLAATISVDPARLLAEIKRVASEIDPRAGKEIEANLGMISRQFGLDIEKDLLAHVGDQWMLVSAPSLGGFLTGTAVTVRLKDAGKFGAALAKLEASLRAMLGQGQPPPAPADQPTPSARRRRAGPAIRSFKSGKVEVHYVHLAAGPRGLARWLGALAPAWAIHDGRLYVAAYPQVVAAAAAGAAEKPLSQAPPFIALRKRLTATPSALCYLNTPALVRRLYGGPLVGWTLLTSVLARQTGAALRPEMLPGLPKIEKYLSPDIYAISADAKGITTEYYGSGLAGLASVGLPVGPSLAVSILLPTLSWSRALAKRAVSAANLRGIGVACELYAADHKNRFPADLIKLVEAGVIAPRILMSPTSGRKVRLDAKGKPIGPFDYVYLGGGMNRESVKNPARIILAYERPEINRLRGTNVLYVDGHVVWLSMPRFRRELKRTRAFLENQAGKDDKGL